MELLLGLISPLLFFVISYYILIAIRNYVVIPFLLLPSIFLSKGKLDEIRKARSQYIQRTTQRNEVARILPVTSWDNLKLDAMCWIHPSELSKPPEQQKWILWLNANGVFYEQIMELLEDYARRVGCSIMSVNYRGVGLSEGFPLTSNHLVSDAEAAFKYLLDQGVHAEHILIHGHSMGGGVGVLLRGKYANGPIINDRSYNTLTTVVSDVVYRIPFLRMVISGMIGFWFGVFCWLLLGTEVSSFFTYTFAGMLGLNLMGYYFHWSVYFLSVIVIYVLRWNIDAISIWKTITGPKLIVYTEYDGIISYSRASLWNAISKLEKSGKLPSGGTKILEIKMHPRLPQLDPYYHCCPLSETSIWSEIISFAKTSLKISHG
eukprot:TRINITY_DN15973_c0_g1_i1.p1 TRINITY_DN15973_c0_g1~~TRINITY_DN15973_c0_g1_i1.p1  ORF type:complete len:376 (+),score=35.88 TRINITY_DN15973_c0_g1_i1:115-1242(+)